MGALDGGDHGQGGRPEGPARHQPTRSGDPAQPAGRVVQLGEGGQQFGGAEGQVEAVRRRPGRSPRGRTGRRAGTARAWPAGPSTREISWTRPAASRRASNRRRSRATCGTRPVGGAVHHHVGVPLQQRHHRGHLVERGACGTDSGRRAGRRSPASSKTSRSRPSRWTGQPGRGPELEPVGLLVQADPLPEAAWFDRHRPLGGNDVGRHQQQPRRAGGIGVELAEDAGGHEGERRPRGPARRRRRPSSPSVAGGGLVRSVRASLRSSTAAALTQPARSSHQHLARRRGQRAASAAGRGHGVRRGRSAPVGPQPRPPPGDASGRPSGQRPAPAGTSRRPAPAATDQSSTGTATDPSGSATAARRPAGRGGVHPVAGRPGTAGPPGWRSARRPAARRRR